MNMSLESDCSLKKQQRRAAKAANLAKLTQPPTESSSTGPVDCACVIHGQAYDWSYVDRLYSMLSRHVTRGIRLHVYTEQHRTVPDHMVKHVLTDWPGVSGRKKAWWYKMQLFNPAHHSGQLLYFDLDTVIVGNLDWVTSLSLQYFWAIQDFRYLWKPQHQGINSSMMYWNTLAFATIWHAFDQGNQDQIRKTYPGDQDYISAVLQPKMRRFFEHDTVQSWRWQALDGGMNFKNRTYKTPGRGTQLTPNTSVLIFHGNPKPGEVKDPVIQTHWR